jgi:hypothetical protein
MRHLPLIDDEPGPLDQAIFASLLQEVREGRDPLVTTDVAMLMLVAFGRPLNITTMQRDLKVKCAGIGGRNVARFSGWLTAADEHIARMTARPNLKALAANRARGRKGAVVHAAELVPKRRGRPPKLRPVAG